MLRRQTLHKRIKESDGNESDGSFKTTNPSPFQNNISIIKDSSKQEG